MDEISNCTSHPSWSGAPYQNKKQIQKVNKKQYVWCAYLAVILFTSNIIPQKYKIRQLFAHKGHNIKYSIAFQHGSWYHRGKSVQFIYYNPSPLYVVGGFAPVPAPQGTKKDFSCIGRKSERGGGSRGDGER